MSELRSVVGFPVLERREKLYFPPLILPAAMQAIVSKVYMFLLHFESSGEGGAFRFNCLRTDLGVFSLPDLELERISPAWGNSNVLFGASVFDHEGYLYIYSTRAAGFGKNCLAARVLPSAPDAPEFWDGASWSDSYVPNAFLLQNDGEPVKVPNMFSVFRLESPSMTPRKPGEKSGHTTPFYIPIFGSRAREFYFHTASTA